MDRQNFLDKIKQKNPKADLRIIGQAFDIAQAAHQDQKRKSGEPFFIHPLNTALVLAEWEMDSATIAAGLLHDVLDDTKIQYPELEKKIGPEIAKLADGVAKVDAIRYSEELKTTENLRKLLLATTQDIRVILIKLADRLHNIQTLSPLEPEKQKRFALETQEIYAPIAYRLGMKKLSGQLEDLAFPCSNPKEYQWLTRIVKRKYEDRKKDIEKIKPIVETALKKEGVKVIEIHTRAKRYFSLFKKLQKYNMDINKVYDMVALRIIVKNIEDCYRTLGIVHKLWRPLPDRVKDYISLPKPNGYQSLHTTVFCQEQGITEFQIRTAKMHQQAEFGIAAHWHYEEQKGLKSYIKRIFSRAPKKQSSMMERLQRWREELSQIPIQDFLKSIRTDFLNNRIYVFTPKGDVIELPEGATPVDFAYQIHTSIGHRCSGAKIDGKMSALDTPLENKQIVEILTQKEEKPSRDWLGFVKTSLARSRIKSWLLKKEGRISLEPEKAAKKTSRTKKEQTLSGKKIKPAKLIEVSGNSGISVHLAKCCLPKPDDKITGYISVAGKHVTVHRADCPNLSRIKNTDRVVPVKWR